MRYACLAAVLAFMPLQGQASPTKNSQDSCNAFAIVVSNIAKWRDEGTSMANQMAMLAENMPAGARDLSLIATEDLYQHPNISPDSAFTISHAVCGWPHRGGS